MRELINTFFLAGGFCFGMAFIRALPSKPTPAVVDFGRVCFARVLPETTTADGGLLAASLAFKGTLGRTDVEFVPQGTTLENLNARIDELAAGRHCGVVILKSGEI